MHILIGLITAIAGLVWALHSLQNAGFNLNALNPFAWARRRKWQRQLGTKPMHALTDSMDAAALLVVAIAKEHGDITRETKLEILSMFETEFGIKRNKTIELYASSMYLLQNPVNIVEEVRYILKPSKESFENSHVTKLIEMLNRVANLEGVTDNQCLIIKAVEQELNLNEKQPKSW